MLDSISANYNNKCLTFQSAWIETWAVCRVVLSKEGKKNVLKTKSH